MLSVPPRDDRLTRLSQEPWRASPAALAVRMSQGSWRRAKHLNLISEKLTEAAVEGNKRILIEIAPRHGKSELCSHWGPVWYVANWPQEKIILVCYEAGFAASWGRKARDEITMHPELGIKVRSAVSATDWWELEDGGGMVTAGIGGPITGKGARLIVIDDPVKNWEEAQSIVYREKTWEWYQRVLYTRREPGASIVCLMQRWHRDDLGGRLIRDSGERWDRVTLPSLALQKDVLGRKPGEALWPDRFNREELEKVRIAVGPGAWLAQYQQQPELAMGDCFFDEAKLAAQLEGSKDGFKFQSYNPMRRYVAWIDAAGTGKDRPSLSIMAWYGTQFTYVVDYTEDVGIHEFCLKAIDILHEFHDPHVGWERNGVGEGVNQIFKAQGYPETKIYYQDRDKGKHGVAMTANLGMAQLVRLATAIASEEAVIPSKRAINECLLLVKQPNGPPAAAPGAHDDIPRAMAGALWLSEQVPNYPVNPNDPEIARQYAEV